MALPFDNPNEACRRILAEIYSMSPPAKEAALKDDWIPTPANINALPEPLRAYIHDLNTVCDPAGDVRELFRLQTENRMS